MKHIFASAAIALLVLICGLLLWLRNFQNAGFALDKAKREKRDTEREAYLTKLENKMDAVEDKQKQELKTQYLLFREEFYFAALPDDDKESIHEVLRRRKRRKTTS